MRQLDLLILQIYKTLLVLKSLKIPFIDFLAYLSTIKDESTNEILAYEISDNLKLKIATNAIEKLCRKRFKLSEGCFIHSDQGVHYTNPKFQSLLKKKNIKQ